MELLIIITYHPYEICKRFHHHIPHVSDYLIKTIGIDQEQKKNEKHCKKLGQGKRSGKHYKCTIQRHLKRKFRKPKKHKTHKHETAKPF